MTPGILGWIYSLAILIPGIAVCVRRLHDVGRSGWFYLLILIPLVGAIILLVLLCTEGQRMSNKWGEDPKQSERLSSKHSPLPSSPSPCQGRRGEEEGASYALNITRLQT